MSQLDDCKRRFAELVVSLGANVQRDQQVLIMTEPSNIDLADMAAEFCYQRGARYVDVKVGLPRVARYHLLSAPEDRLTYVPTYQTVQMDQLVDSGGALIAFRSQDEPDLYQDLDEAQQKQLNRMLVGRREASKRYREEGVLKRKVGWCLAGPPSPKWAQKIFPELGESEAVEALERTGDHDICRPGRLSKALVGAPRPLGHSYGGAGQDANQGAAVLESQIGHRPESPTLTRSSLGKRSQANCPGT